jgi:hypothetical protein
MTATKVWLPKEYLFHHGKIDNPKQRGRMSLPNRAFIEDAVRNGVLIEGYSPDNTAPVGDGPVPVSRVAVDPNAVVEVPDESRPELSFQAYVGTNEVGMRTVCNVCWRSLNYCHCESPRIWVDYDREGVVNFQPRKTPKKRWY